MKTFLIDYALIGLGYGLAILYFTAILAGCTLPQVIYINRGYDSMPDYSSRPQNLVNPLPQPGSSMSFMCRNAINRGDSGGAFIFC